MSTRKNLKNAVTAIEIRRYHLLALKQFMRAMMRYEPFAMAIGGELVFEGIRYTVEIDAAGLPTYSPGLHVALKDFERREAAADAMNHGSRG